MLTLSMLYVNISKSYRQYFSHILVTNECYFTTKHGQQAEKILYIDIIIKKNIHGSRIYLYLVIELNRILVLDIMFIASFNLSNISLCI